MNVRKAKLESAYSFLLKYSKITVCTLHATDLPSYIDKTGKTTVIPKIS